MTSLDYRSLVFTFLGLFLIGLITMRQNTSADDMLAANALSVQMVATMLGLLTLYMGGPAWVSGQRFLLLLVAAALGALTCATGQ